MYANELDMLGMSVHVVFFLVEREHCVPTHVTHIAMRPLSS